MQAEAGKKALATPPILKIQVGQFFFFHNAFFPFCRALIKLIVDLFILLFSFFLQILYQVFSSLCLFFHLHQRLFLVSFLHILRYLIAVLQNNFQLALIRAKRFSRQCPLRVFYFYAVHYYSSYSLTVTIVSVFNRARFVAVLLFLKCQVFVYRNLFLFAFLSSKTLITSSGGPWSSGVSFFCFVSPRA